MDRCPKAKTEGLLDYLSEHYHSVGVINLRLLTYEISQKANSKNKKWPQFYKSSLLGGVRNLQQIFQIFGNRRFLSSNSKNAPKFQGAPTRKTENGLNSTNLVHWGHFKPLSRLSFFRHQCRKLAAKFSIFLEIGDFCPQIPKMPQNFKVLQHEYQKMASILMTLEGVSDLAVF